jgi:hypothetical protein
MPELEVDYRGTVLRVEVKEPPSARLLINGMERSVESAANTPCTFRLSSPVQTDYEWHEIIEAIVQFGAESVTIALTANSTHLAEKTAQLERGTPE